MIKIYLDNTLLGEDNYISFTVNNKMFDNSFYLGSTSSVEALLTIPSDALPSSITEVEVRENTEVLFNFVVDEITINNDAEAEIKLVDKMILLQKQYDFSQYVPITAKNLLIKICDDFGITYNYTSFTNEDLEINSYDNTLTARDYVGFIAEASGGYARMMQDELKLNKYITGTFQFTPDDIDEYKLGEKIAIERVVYEFGATKYETSSDETLNTLILDANNPFLQVMTEEQFNDLSDNILDFEFYNIKINTCNLFSFDDTCIKLDDYDLLNQFEVSYGGGYVGSYETNIDNQQQELTQIVSNDKKIRRIKQIVDQNNARMELISEEVEEYENRIATLEVSSTGILEEVRSKVNQDEYDAYVEETATKINQTSDLIRSEVSKIITGENSIQKVETTGTILDQNGLSVYREGSDTQTIIDDKGISVESGGSVLLKAKIENGDSVIESKYLKVNEYLSIGTRSRFEDYNEDENGNTHNFTGVFWIGE